MAFMETFYEGPSPKRARAESTPLPIAQRPPPPRSRCLERKPLSTFHFHSHIHLAWLALKSAWSTYVPFMFRFPTNVRIKQDQHGASSQLAHQDPLVDGQKRIQTYSDRLEARCYEMVFNGLPHLFDECSDFITDVEQAQGTGVVSLSDSGNNIHDGGGVQQSPMVSDEEGGNNATQHSPAKETIHGRGSTPPLPTFAHHSLFQESYDIALLNSPYSNPWSSRKHASSAPVSSDDPHHQYHHRPNTSPITTITSPNTSKELHDGHMIRKRKRGDLANEGAERPHNNDMSMGLGFRVALAESLEEMFPPLPEDDRNINFGITGRCYSCNTASLSLEDCSLTCCWLKDRKKMVAFEMRLQTAAFRLIEICSSIERTIQWSKSNNMGKDDTEFHHDRRFGGVLTEQRTRNKPGKPKFTCATQNTPAVSSLSPHYTASLDLDAIANSGVIGAGELQVLSKGTNRILDMMEQYHKDLTAYSTTPDRMAASTFMAASGNAKYVRPSRSFEEHQQDTYDENDVFGRLMAERHVHRLKMCAVDLQASAIGLYKILTRHVIRPPSH